MTRNPTGGGDPTEATDTETDTETVAVADAGTEAVSCAGLV